ncbi:MAG: transporter substrate-binding domain-containing protein, partial [Fimbriimonadaceae bacterium]|nr:transporter substrate-binding domain-containing protein [Alphaproteobacteria bacterium]
ISIMFWLDSAAADNCCIFVGGPFTESYYFGEGVAIAVTKGNDKLRTALNYGLREIHKNGKFLEIFLRHFPQSFY